MIQDDIVDFIKQTKLISNMALKNAFLFSILLTMTLTVLGQMEKKTNTILFSELLVGHAWGKGGGFSGGVVANYQIRRSLFTVRFIGTTKLHSKIASPIIPIPIIEQRSNLEETGFLYGWRFVQKASAYSFSLGASYNAFSHLELNNLNQKVTKKISYVGVPFEMNIKLFKAQKERFRIYGLFPVGRPTALGGSIGLKLFGNISRNSYCGFGLVYGLGFHKKYL